MSEQRREATAGARSPVVKAKEPDEMGVWSEEGDVIWLPRSLYPKRADAIMWALKQWDYCCSFVEVRCLARWMRYEPFVAENLDDKVAWSEDQWYECENDALGAFQVWRLESA